MKIRRVIQLNPYTGKTVAEYQSITAAYKATGIDKANIMAAGYGRRYSAGGFRWRIEYQSVSGEGYCQSCGNDGELFKVCEGCFKKI